MTAWAESLDALEEWVRQVTDGTVAGTAPGLPPGPVPAALKVRALALHAAMDEALAAGRAARQVLDRSAAYATS